MSLRANPSHTEAGARTWKGWRGLIFVERSLPQDKNTPLHYAAMYGSAETVDSLIKAQDDVKAKTKVSRGVQTLQRRGL